MRRNEPILRTGRRVLLVVGTVAALTGCQLVPTAPADPEPVDATPIVIPATPIVIP